MTEDLKVLHGTTAWFEMVGTVMKDAAAHAKLSPDFNVCLVERYTDGVELGPGLVPGLRFEIIGGKPTFRLGARHGERGDITVEVTAAASRTLNTLRGAGPDFHTALAALLANGELKVDGELSRLGSWFSVVHDRIVARTS
jgi:hypothetical protein